MRCSLPFLLTCLFAYSVTPYDYYRSLATPSCQNRLLVYYMVLHGSELLILRGSTARCTKRHNPAPRVRRATLPYRINDHLVDSWPEMPQIASVKLYTLTA
jgi:hypothetical protein